MDKQQTRNKMKQPLFATLFFIQIVFLISSCSNSVIYVKTDGAGQGTSWDDAIGDIQSALDLANSGDTIWIAAGTYSPKDKNGFRVDKTVNLYGGFSGVEATLEERIFDDSLNFDSAKEELILFANHVTVIDGDINSDDDLEKWNYDAAYDFSESTDAWDECNLSDNAQHLFYTSEEFDGELNINGISFQSGAAINGNGGAINIRGDLKVELCIFDSNIATDNGGAICCLPAVDESEVEVLITKSFFWGGRANEGGAIYIDAFNGKVDIDYNAFSTLEVNDTGGAISHYARYDKDTPDNISPSVKITYTDNFFYKCKAYSRNSNLTGGGVYIAYHRRESSYEDNQMSIEGNRFYLCSLNNESKDSRDLSRGAGICTSTIYKSIEDEPFKTYYQASVKQNVFQSCHITALTGKGGGAYIDGETLFANNLVEYCDLWVPSNYTDKSSSTQYNFQGAGIYADANSKVDSCIIRKCISKSYGGGAYIDHSQLMNSKLYNCRADNMGGGVFNASGIIYNSVISNCTAGDGGGVELSKAGITSKEPLLQETTVVNCRSNNNSGLGGNGGVYVRSQATMRGCIVYGNSNKRNHWSGSKSYGYQIGSGIGGMLTINESAIENYTGGRNDIIRLEKGKSKKRDSQKYYPDFEKPTVFSGCIWSYTKKTKEQKQLVDIENSNWSLPENSPILDFGVSREIANLTQEQILN